MNPKRGFIDVDALIDETKVEHVAVGYLEE